MRRDPRRYLVLMALTIMLGLLSRRFPGLLPAMLGKYPGDLLWGLMVYWIWGLLLRNKTTLHVTIASTLFALAIEFFKLFHTPSLDQFRTTGLGKLLLGVGFSWLNLLCYLLGILVGVCIELKFFKPSRIEDSKK